MKKNWHAHLSVPRLALPIILANLSMPVVGLVDTAVAGQMGDSRYQAALAIGATLFAFVLGIFNFVKMVTTGVIAQYRGREDWQGCRLALRLSLRRALLMGLLCALATPLLLLLAERYAHHAPQTHDALRAYLGLRLLGIGMSLVLMTLTAALIGLARPGAAMRVLLSLNLCNVVLDLLFVLGFGWGMASVAIASLLAETLAVVLALRALAHTLPGWSWRQVWQPAPAMPLALGRIQLLMCGRSILLQLAFAGFTYLSSSHGLATTAANGVLLQVFMLMTYALDGYAHAAEILVGASYGAGQRRAFWQACRQSFAWALLSALLLGTLAHLTYPFWIAWLSPLASVRTQAEALAPWVCWLILSAMPCFILDGIFAACTRAGQMLLGMLASVLVFALLLWGWQAQDNAVGLWLSLHGFMLARALAFIPGCFALRRHFAAQRA